MFSVKTFKWDIHFVIVTDSKSLMTLLVWFHPDPPPTFSDNDTEYDVFLEVVP